MSVALLWMLYASAMGGLVVLTAWCIEQVSRARQAPTRAIWMATMALLVVLSLGLVMGRTPWSTGRGVGPTAHIGAAGIGLPHVLGAWALVSAFLLGVIVHAAAEGRRLQHGLPRRRLFGSTVLVSDLAGPSAVGPLVPRILLPPWALELDDALLQLIVRHEQEHLEARDPLVLLVALLAVVAVPWNPALWFAWRRLRLAIEIDCDTRVLRVHPNVQRYAELLLLTAQRVRRTPWASQPLITVVAPLRPFASQLAERIRTMTQPPSVRSIGRTTGLLLGAAATASVALALPAPVPTGKPVLAPTSVPPAAPAIVDLTDVRVLAVPASGDSLAEPVLMFTTGDARIALGNGPWMPLRDTLRLYRLPAMAADVTDGDVHLAVSGTGELSVAGAARRGRSIRLSATGPHIVLRQGGLGIGGADRLPAGALPPR